MYLFASATPTMERRMLLSENRLVFPIQLDEAGRTLMAKSGRISSFWMARSGVSPDGVANRRRTLALGLRGNQYGAPLLPRLPCLPVDVVHASFIDLSAVLPVVKDLLHLSVQIRSSLGLIQHGRSYERLFLSSLFASYLDLVLPICRFQIPSVMLTSECLEYHDSGRIYFSSFDALFHFCTMARRPLSCAASTLSASLRSDAAGVMVHGALWYIPGKFSTPGEAALYLMVELASGQSHIWTSESELPLRGYSQTALSIEVVCLSLMVCAE